MGTRFQVFTVQPPPSGADHTTLPRNVYVYELAYRFSLIFIFGTIFVGHGAKGQAYRATVLSPYEFMKFPNKFPHAQALFKFLKLGQVVYKQRKGVWPGHVRSL